MPPPLRWSGAPPTTRPVGEKKLEPKTRSKSCMKAAASRGGKASSSRNAVTICVQTKNGSRIHVRPLARRFTIVVMKLTELSSDEVMLKAIAMIHIDWPVSARGHLGLCQRMKSPLLWLSAKL